MTKVQARRLMASIIIARSSAYLFSKYALESLAVFNVIAFRFMIAFIILAVIFRQKILSADLKTILRGAVLGTLFFSFMILELNSLKTTETSIASFLINTSVVFVPILDVVLFRKSIRRSALICALIAMCGIALLNLNGAKFSFSAGKLMCISAAVIYAFAIILTERFSHKSDALSLGIFQIGFVGSFAIIFSFIFETPALPSTPLGWGSVLGLSLICTLFGFTFQPLAQSKLDAEEAGLFCSLSPACAFILGVVILNEPITLHRVCGAALILASLLLPHLLNKKPVQRPKAKSC